MTRIVIHFANETTANFLVAGIPAAARAVHHVALATDGGHNVARCIIAVPGGWTPTPWCKAELARLAPRLPVQIADAHSPKATGTLHLRGESLLESRVIADLLHRTPATGYLGGLLPARFMQTASAPGAIEGLRRKSAEIVAATIKPGDGIVSRYINRPVSQLISRTVLRLPGVKPGHATSAAALLGAGMAGCLFAGGENGAIMGAVLYQLASIVDGVDGEIARATHRSSLRGAMLDSLTDAATNVSFFAGLAFNLAVRGHGWAATAGLAGLTLLFVGLVLIGRRARATRQPFTFDAVKHRFLARPSTLRKWLTWLTMRDFYAAAAALGVAAGFASHVLFVFAAAAATWLGVSVAVLARGEKP